MRSFPSTWRRHTEPALYILWAALWALASARSFYGYLLKQTGGEWSAPLDDVFIHFDFARAAATGHPFEWVPGNGFSSGGTSWLYPLVLAIGSLLGFADAHLMVWAAIVATTSVFGLLLALRQMAVPPEADRWARVASFALPPVVLGIGALSWSFWSGMEVAFFMAIWSLALLAYLAMARDESQSARGWWLGAAGVLMVCTRPEAITTILVFALFAAHARARSSKQALAILMAQSMAPAVIAMILQMLANRIWTGEFSANGAISKLALNNPFMSDAEKAADYLSNLQYALLRNVEYHFADVAPFGMIVPALALFGLSVPASRGPVALLLAQAASWTALVALNGQVRWQNERYLMPAVVWLLAAAVFGAAALLRPSGRPKLIVGFFVAIALVHLHGVITRPPLTAPSLQHGWLVACVAAAVGLGALQVWYLRVACVFALLGLAYQHQIPNMRGQRWFFGRAARNIRDQHVTLGRYLRREKPKRVLVGDAGAIIYASGAPALDIIGLGGFHKLPFARANVHGLGASLELIERMRPDDRPDLLAIFPTWWGVLPVWFAESKLASFPAPGNVICGGYEHAVYRARWPGLGAGENPNRLQNARDVVDVVDVGDLVSERAHDYAFPKPAGGWVDMRLLPDSDSSGRDVFDAGRIIAPGRVESFTLRGLRAHKPLRIIIRTAAEASTRIALSVGTIVQDVWTRERETWDEVAIDIPEAHVQETLHVQITNEGLADFTDYHVWAVQPRP